MATVSIDSAVTAVAVLVAQQVLQQHLERVRQPRHVEALLQRVEPEDLVIAAGVEFGAGTEAVRMAHVLNATTLASRGY